MAVSTDQQGSIDSLGKCYSTRDCQQYSAAAWWEVDQKQAVVYQVLIVGVIQIVNVNQHVLIQQMTKVHWVNATLHVIASTTLWLMGHGPREIVVYLAVGVGVMRRCQPTCSTSTPQPNAGTTLGKCYSTRDCQSYSKAGGSWTKEDCCLIGSLCWCDLNQVCQPSCSASTHATTKPTAAFLKKSPTIHTDPVSVRTSAPRIFPANFPTQHTEPASSTTAFPKKSPIMHTDLVAVHTSAPSTFCT